MLSAPRFAIANSAGKIFLCARSGLAPKQTNAPEEPFFDGFVSRGQLAHRAVDIPDCSGSEG
jgi:hypothetical protein